MGRGNGLVFVAVRARGNQNLGVMSLADFSQKIAQDIASKA